MGYEQNVENMRSKIKYFRVSPKSGGGENNPIIGEQTDFMLRATRNSGKGSDQFDDMAKNVREATYDLKHIQNKYGTSIFGRFYTTEDEYLSPKSVLNVLGSKMTTKFKYELAERRNFRYNHIYDRTFMRDMEFDGYEADDDHMWFHMGLQMGESLVINPLFQFHENDDVRTHARYTKLGRIYAESIYADQTILGIMPGTIKYHTGLLKMIGLELGTTATTAKYIRSGGGGIGNFFRGIWMGAGDVLGVVATVGAAVFGKAKMVEFVERPRLYGNYINGLVQATAVNMGLISGTGAYAGTSRKLDYYSILPGAKLAEGKWGGEWFKRWRSTRIINFRCGNDISVSETFSNSTTSNPIADAMNAESTEAAANDMAGNADKFSKLIGDFASKDLGTAFMSVAKNFGHKLASGVSQMSFIKSGGGKANFPEVYESSSFSRSYSFSFTFHSPYGTRESIFENAYVPMLFLLAMSLPRQVGSFSYIEPFALKCVVPGMLNINFGIIESLSIERGDSQNDWTQQNIPKTIKCSVSIKDMDVNIALPLASRGYRESLFPSLFAASGISEYLITLSGLSLAEQMDTGKRHQRNWRKFVTGWRNRLDLDTIEGAVANSGLGNFVQFFTGIMGNEDPTAQGKHDLDAITGEYSKMGIQDPKWSRNFITSLIAKVNVGIKDGTKKVSTTYLKENEWDHGDVEDSTDTFEGDY